VIAENQDAFLLDALAPLDAPVVLQVVPELDAEPAFRVWQLALDDSALHVVALHWAGLASVLLPFQVFQPAHRGALHWGVPDLVLETTAPLRAQEPSRQLSLARAVPAANSPNAAAQPLSDLDLSRAVAARAAQHGEMASVWSRRDAWQYGPAGQCARVRLPPPPRWRVKVSTLPW
jgi:hypothetical protein